MVNKEVVIETIKKMRSSGIEDAVIKDTLKSIGLSAREAEEYMAEVFGKRTPEQKEEATEEHEKIAGRTAAEVKKHLDEHREEAELRETKTHAALIEHAEKLGEVEGGISKLDEKFSTFEAASPEEISSKIDSAARKISALEAKISDLKAQVSATKSIMEKILDANRKILSKMK